MSRRDPPVPRVERGRLGRAGWWVTAQESPRHLCLPWGPSLPGCPPTPEHPPQHPPCPPARVRAPRSRSGGLAASSCWDGRSVLPIPEPVLCELPAPRPQPALPPRPCQPCGPPVSPGFGAGKRSRLRELPGGGFGCGRWCSPGCLIAGPSPASNSHLPTCSPFSAEAPSELSF